MTPWTVDHGAGLQIYLHDSPEIQEVLKNKCKKIVHFCINLKFKLRKGRTTTPSSPPGDERYPYMCRAFIMFFLVVDPSFACRHTWISIFCLRVCLFSESQVCRSSVVCCESKIKKKISPPSSAALCPPPRPPLSIVPSPVVLHTHIHPHKHTLTHTHRPCVILDLCCFDKDTMPSPLLTNLIICSVKSCHR